MLACKPHTTFWTAFSQRFNVLVQLDSLFRFARLKCCVRAPAREFVVLPIGRQDIQGLTTRGKVMIRQAGIVRAEEGVKPGEVFFV